MLLREEFPDLKIRFINVVDLFKLQPSTEHPHGLTDRDFDSLFTVDKPIIFNFHGYPWLIHRLAYGRTNTSICMCAVTRRKATSTRRWSWPSTTRSIASAWRSTRLIASPKLQRIGGHAKEKFRNQQIACRAYAYEHGIDSPEITGWRWPQRSA